MADMLFDSIAQATVYHCHVALTKIRLGEGSSNVSYFEYLRLA
jgi:hypothetical protein